MTKRKGSKVGIMFLLCIATASGQTYTVLASLNGKNGADSQFGSLVQGRDGNFYGATSEGGSGPQHGYGTIFRVTPTGTITTLHLFQGQDGIAPSGLVLGTDGNLYGATAQGGTSRDAGTIFQLTANGVFTSLYSFHGFDGSIPYGTLVQGINGNLYGTTVGGGTSNDGTIFEAGANGVRTLHTFDIVDGEGPWGGLVLGTDGDFYGTTPIGGTNNNGNFEGQTTCGTIFKITPGARFTTIHNFDGADGSGAYAPLIQAIDGNFYGTTSPGGEPNEYGSVYKASANGTVTTLHNFDGADGADPFAPLIQATDGNFYGTTDGGGPNNGGTIFTITPQGALTTLYSFCAEQNCVDGWEPLTGLLQSTNGAIYGMTRGGGADDDGVIFSLDLGFGPFVAFVARYGRVGGAAEILGQAFTGTTAVSLNGVPANFKVVSDTYLTAVVPAGATTGYVTVTTPTGVLTSNVPFRVIQ